MSEGARLNIVSPVNTFDGSQDPSDHAIDLIDTTNASEGNGPSRSRSASPGWKRLARNPTPNTIREEFARRKYAKWREELPSSNNVRVREEEAPDRPAITRGYSSQQMRSQPPTQAIQAAGFGGGTETSRARLDRAHAHPQKHRHRLREAPYEIDVLYENQRGLFLCGTPYYSHSSLLNFDPGPWVTKDLKDSAVNITNAQVPDPSWEWSWKSWYVDMSYDVDEEGWQYSFAFANRYAWHGNHPWFHAYVRRRRWLRKRVKKQVPGLKKGDGSMGAAHQLRTDYFTIHSKRDRSPGGSLADGSATTAQPDKTVATEAEKIPDEIKDIPTLLKAIRLSMVDREKIDAVKKFVDQGGDELAYLGDHIPDVMSRFLFQNSKAQFLEFLKQSAYDAQKHRDEHNAEGRSEGIAEARKTDNLLSAIKKAELEINSLDYWSDRKHMLRPADDRQDVAPGTSDRASIRSRLEDNPVDMIKGISSEAEIEVDPTSKAVNPLVDKGKGRATDDGDLPDNDTGPEKKSEAEPEPRLGQDSLFIASAAGGG